MIRSAVLVPAPGYGEPWDWAYDVEAAALEAAAAAAAAPLERCGGKAPLIEWSVEIGQIRFVPTRLRVTQKV